MRKDLLPADGRYYKANLHCHSTVSDGALTPEELKRAYREKDYSILALTDHEQLLAHPELDDDDFLTITAYEMAVREGGYKTTDDNRIVHMNLYAKDPKNTTQICYDPENAAKHIPQARRALVHYAGAPERSEYSPNFINHLLTEAKKNGFLVSYNHPDWGLESAADYLAYDGFFAVEVYNHSCFMDVGLPEENQQVYDQMLRSGKRLFCTCNDDNHNRAGLDPDKTDSFGGFNMICAKTLTYRAVMDSLQKGDFYASCGPLIHALWVEDGQLHIQCSPVRDILLVTSGRKGAHVRASGETLICQATFEWRDSYRYVRLVLIGADGKKAFTRAYFREEAAIE